jgi:hypothetical protein
LAEVEHFFDMELRPAQDAADRLVPLDRFRLHARRDITPVVADPASAEKLDAQRHVSDAEQLVAGHQSIGPSGVTSQCD